MAKKSESEILQSLQTINWDFEDYSSAKYPLDINSIPWYPATFPAPIPKYLVALLSEPGDIVFDPFSGKGTTAIEALKQRRIFIYNDFNPHAVVIMQCLIDALCQDEDDNFLVTDKMETAAFVSPGEQMNYKGKDEAAALSKLPDNIKDELGNRKINLDTIYWFHASTLLELIHLYDYINRFDGAAQGKRKLAFLSILKVVSSQRGHFSYVTDNCKPGEMKYYNAINAYNEMLERIQKACTDFRRQYNVLTKTKDLQEFAQLCRIYEGDAKKCPYIQDESVDLVVTSPPYLCSQDYILTMRLNDFFFPSEGFISKPLKEIGPRRLRTRQGITDAYFADMDLVLKEVFRVLKKGAYFCLIIGQGEGKVSEGIDVINLLQRNAGKVGFSELYKKTRKISHQTTRVGKVKKEEVILFRKY